MANDLVEDVARALHAIELSWNDTAWEHLPAVVIETFRAQAIAVIPIVVAHERTQIVEFMRELSGDALLPLDVTTGEVWILRRCAESIERGEYLAREAQ